MEVRATPLNPNLSGRPRPATAGAPVGLVEVALQQQHLAAVLAQFVRQRAASHAGPHNDDVPPLRRRREDLASVKCLTGATSRADTRAREFLAGLPASIVRTSLPFSAVSLIVVGHRSLSCSLVGDVARAAGCAAALALAALEALPISRRRCRA